MKNIFLFALCFICISYSSLSQNKEGDYDKLVEKLNNYLSHYTNYTGNEYGFISLNHKQLGFTEKEIKALKKEDLDFPINKDSIDVQDLIFTYQEKIINSLSLILKHKDFDEKIKETTFNQELSIVFSTDNKLYNFSLDEKTGGTYRSRISLMYYTESDSIYEGDIFEPDGYGLIDTIQTNSGVKYLMEGNVRGCSYCFTNHVSLIQFKKDTVNLDFYYRFDSRDWDDYIEVDSTKRVIKAYYHLNDLQESCSCNNEDEGTIEVEIEKNISCSCRFKFNGETFELVEKKEKVILEK
jgi:hypothetical protein